MSPSNEASHHLATHWTRLFYRDLDAPWRDASSADEPSAEVHSRGSAAGPAFGARTLMVAAAMLLGAFASLTLGASGLDRGFAHDGTVRAQPACDRPDPQAGSGSRRAPMPPSPIFA